MYVCLLFHPFVSALEWSTRVQTVLQYDLLSFRNCNCGALESLVITSHALLKEIRVEASALFDKHQTLGIFMIWSCRKSMTCRIKFNCDGVLSFLASIHKRVLSKLEASLFFLRSIIHLETPSCDQPVLFIG